MPRRKDRHAKTEELLLRLRTVLNRLLKVGLKVKPSKCAIFQKSIHFLGHVISESGVQPQPEKLKAIKDWTIPKMHQICTGILWFSVALPQIC